MINQLDIEKFGSFQGLEWKKRLNQKDASNPLPDFKRLNVFYGRNYSGKTTLSRIFRALEVRKTPLHYEGPIFTVHGDKGQVNQNSLADHGYDIRVYNRDFVSDNLSFLVHQQLGNEIKAFAIVGEHNKKIDDEITAIEARLGNVDEKKGLRFELDIKKKKRDNAKNSHLSVFKSLEDKLRKHANEKIKKNSNYKDVNYDIRRIEEDIKLIGKKGFKPLVGEEKANMLALLKQDVLPDIQKKIDITLKVELSQNIVEPLLSKVIRPSVAIEELLNDTDLQGWVKQGIDHHRDKRTTCAFCRQNLPHDIWQVLGEHFNKESKTLEAELNEAIRLVDYEINDFADFKLFTEEQFYTDNQARFKAIKSELSDALALYKKDVETLKGLLETRKRNLFQTVPIGAPLHNPEEVNKHIASINTLISENNNKTKTLEQDKEGARKLLRLTDVFEFLQGIQYDNEVEKINRLQIEWEAAEGNYKNVESDIRDLERRVEELRSEQKDERKAVENINSLLNNFFGVDGIQLEAKDAKDKAAVKFEITRNSKPAFNLSEGECSLIAFCYFIARLEDSESKGKDLIVYIDDPISSLDANHIFFLFGLIESKIARPIKNEDGSNRYRYKQLFISTHNLDFLKYLKRISTPQKKILGANGKAKSIPDCEYFMIERNDAVSNIFLMPPYLKDYITEFNYLFHQIHKCKDQANAQNNHEPFFNFGNNLRKFLEAFLFFKYPHHDGSKGDLERIKKFFGESDDTAVHLVNRLINEFSHLGVQPERAFRPVDIPEIAKVAKYVLDKIYASDKEQYNALLKSIGEPERTA